MWDDDLRGFVDFKAPALDRGSPGMAMGKLINKKCIMVPGLREER